jgi:hypothetical protein
VPTFISNGRISINRILNVFGNIVGPAQRLIPPYQFEINIRALEDPPMAFKAKLTSAEELSKGQPTLRLDFKATSEIPGRKINLDAAQKELSLAHDLILQEFEAYFTEEARKSFEPYDSSQPTAVN